MPPIIASGNSTGRRFLILLVTLLICLSFFMHISVWMRPEAHGAREDMLRVVQKAKDVLQKLQQAATSVSAAQTSTIPVLGGEAISNERQCPSCDQLNCNAKLRADSREVSQKLLTCTNSLEACTSMRRISPPSSVVSSNHIYSSNIQNSIGKKWLAIGIPTVSRANNEDYLLQTLARLDDLLPTNEESSLLSNNIVILVIYVQPMAENGMEAVHPRFEEAQKRYRDSTFFQFHTVVSSPQPSGLPLNDIGNANTPGYRVRKQTRDLATVLKIAADKAEYYLFLEDDMLLCKDGFTSIQYMLHKASKYHPNWIAIRASYGMNGIVMRGGHDLLTFAEYLEKHQSRRPPDHLVVEWYAGETAESKAYRGPRQNIGFKYNLFEHIGLVSTLRSQRSGAFPRCYDSLVEPVVFQVEAYDPVACPADDMWPCSHVQKQYSLNLASLRE